MCITFHRFFRVWGPDHPHTLLKSTSGSVNVFKSGPDIKDASFMLVHWAHPKIQIRFERNLLEGGFWHRTLVETGFKYTRSRL